MDVQDLRAIVALADTLNFTTAARKLNMAQPPLSRRIASLEARLGVLLFRRERPLAPTEAGRFLIEQAVQLLCRIDAVAATTRRMGKEKRRYFGIGFVGSTLYGPLPQAIRAMREAHGDLEIGLHELTTSEQRVALESGRIDVGFGRIDLGDTVGIRRRTILDEPLMLAVATDDRWADREMVTLAEIAGRSFVPYPQRPQPNFADQMLRLLRSTGVAPRIAIEAIDLQTALGMVRAGVGVSMVPRSVAAAQRSDLAFVPIEDGEARSPVILSQRAGDVSPLVETFVRFAQEAVS